MENVLHHRSVILPTNASNRDLPQAFGALFRDKIANIRNELESSLLDDHEGVVTDTDKITDVSG